MHEQYAKCTPPVASLQENSIYIVVADALSFPADIVVSGSVTEAYRALERGCQTERQRGSLPWPPRDAPASIDRQRPS